MLKGHRLEKSTSLPVVALAIFMSYEQDTISVKISHIPKEQDPCEKKSTHNPLKDFATFDRRPQKKDIMEPAKALLLAATRQMGTIFSDLMCLKSLYKN